MLTPSFLVMQIDTTLQLSRLMSVKNATITNENNFTTSGCVTLGSSDFTVDIASKAVGATFGKYTDTTGMIQGRTYRYFVPTLSRSFTITGSVNFTKLSDVHLLGFAIQMKMQALPRMHAT